MNEHPAPLYDPHEIPEDEPRARDPRLVVLYEKHIGIGVRWLIEDGMPYPLHVSLALPFITFEVGLGRWRFGPTVGTEP